MNEERKRFESKNFQAKNQIFGWQVPLAKKNNLEGVFVQLGGDEHGILPPKVGSTELEGSDAIQSTPLTMTLPLTSTVYTWVKGS